MKEAGLLDKKVESEKKWLGRYRDIGLFAMTDFTYEADLPYIDLYDGKGHQQQNADPNQIVHYALNMATTGLKPRRAGLLYWRYPTDGVIDVDVSPKALKAYIDGPFEEASPWLRRLKVGTEPGELLPARPESQKCFNCWWKSTCPDSAHKKEPVEVAPLGAVDL